MLSKVGLILTAIAPPTGCMAARPPYFREPWREPAGVIDLEHAIDLAAASRWVTGDPATIPSLQAEHFDFHYAMAAFGEAEVIPDAREAVS